MAASCGAPAPDSAPPVAPTDSPSGQSDSSANPLPTPAIIDPVPGQRERRADWRLIREAAGPAVMIEVEAGGEPCDAITDLSVSETPTVVDITVWAGRVPGARCDGVPAILGTAGMRVPLKAPLAGRTVRGQG
jgi:hypothetical protein